MMSCPPARASWAVPLVLLLSFWAGCNAYPELFAFGNHAKGCTDHPTGPFADHGAPVPDKTTTFKLSKTGSTTPEAAVCPGTTYDVVVDFKGEKRRALITASAGKFAVLGYDADPKCPNRAASAEGSSATYTNTLTIPCDVTGPKLLLQVTSAGKSVDNFHSASTSLPINPVSQCPGSTCPGAAAKPAAASAAAAPSAATQPPAAATRATPAAAAAAAAPAAKTTAAMPAVPAAMPAVQRSVGSSGSGCRRSGYGYACAVDAKQGATLHYTLDNSPQPPDNACTATAQPSSTSSSAGQQQQYLHMLLESPAQGYSGVGFPQQYGKMYPSDAVIGYVDGASGKPVVSAYHLTNFSPAPSATNSNGLGWASSVGAAKASASGAGGGGSLLCFSRPVDAPQAAVARQLDTSALKLNWVGDSSTSFSQQHDLTNSMVLNVADGTLSRSSSSGDGKLAKQIAHGVLMLLAFVVFMPLGALMARHKWVMGDKQKGGIRPGWFHVHRSIQSLAILLALTGFILALVSFNVPWSHMSRESTPHQLYNPHRVLGVIVVAFSLLQVIGGLMRPSLSHQWRSFWRKGHMLFGWLALAAGVAVVLMGAVMMHDLAGASYVAWLLPILLLLGLVVAAGVVAEIYKAKLEQSGRYEPHTHSFSHSGAQSARSSGTGTPEAEISSKPAGPFAVGKNDSGPFAVGKNDAHIL